MKNYLLLWTFSISGSLVLFYYYLKLLRTMESSKRNSDICDKNILEIDTVRYNVYKQSLGSSSSYTFIWAVTSFVIGCLTIPFYTSQALRIRKEQGTYGNGPVKLSDQWILITTLILLLCAIAGFAYSSAMYAKASSSTAFKDQKALWKASMILTFRYVLMITIVAAFMSEKVRGIFDFQKPKPLMPADKSDLLSTPQAVGFGALILFNLGLSFYIPTNQANMLRSIFTKYKAWLDKGRGLIETMTRMGNKEFNINRIPYNTRKRIIENYASAHPDIGSDMVVAAINADIASGDPLKNPLLYLDIVTYKDVDDTLNDIMASDQVSHEEDYTYDEKGSVKGSVRPIKVTKNINIAEFKEWIRGLENKETTEYVTNIRGKLKTPMVIGAVYTFLHILLLYYKADIGPWVLGAVTVGILLLIVAARFLSDPGAD